MVEQEVIREKLAEYIDDLEQEQTISPNEFMKNKKMRRYIKRTLHLSIECCLDIGSHIISSERLREPTKIFFPSWPRTVTFLTKNLPSYQKWLSSVTLSFLVTPKLTHPLQMAGYRNRMVHFYSMITEKELYEILRDNLADIEQFTAEIKQAVL